MTTARERRARHERVAELAVRQGGLLSRAQLVGLGVTRHQIDHELAARRWTRAGSRVVSVHPGQAPEVRRRWAAVLDAGPEAVLDGVSALQHRGLRAVSERDIHVSVPHGRRGTVPAGAVVHQVCEPLGPDTVLEDGLPCVRSDVAAARAASWARSDRQAALFLAAPVQQRLVTAEEILRVLERPVRRSRHALLRTLGGDLADGAHALGELQFAAACRARGLPRPERQSLRTIGGRRAFLDVEWPGYGLCVEIDGAQHRQGLAPMEDALRDNAQVLAGRSVLRIPLLGLRLAEADFLDQVAAALRQRGWPG